MSEEEERLGKNFKNPHRNKSGRKGFPLWMNQVLQGKRMTKHNRMSVVTEKELKKHNTRDDFWCVFNGKVYDITQFLEYHPGGISILDQFIGEDMTSAFGKCHHWVNWDKSMKCCLIGSFAKGRSGGLKAYSGKM